MTPFDVLLVDPPWRFVTRSPKGNGRGPERHYPTMTLDQLQALPVASLAADNAALFLWCCWPSLFRDVPGLAYPLPQDRAFCCQQIEQNTLCVVKLGHPARLALINNGINGRSRLINKRIKRAPADYEQVSRKL